MNARVQSSFTNKIIIYLDKNKEFEFIIQERVRYVRNIKNKGIIAYFTYIEGTWNKEEKLLGKLTTYLSSASQSKNFMLYKSGYNIQYFDYNKNYIFSYNRKLNAEFEIPEIGILNGLRHHFKRYITAELNSPEPFFPVALYVLGNAFHSEFID